MKRILLLLLAFLLVCVPFLASCSNDTETESTDAETSEPSEFPLEQKNFGGKVITVLTRNKHYSQQFVPNEEYEGSVINTAIQRRNDYIKENYGLEIAVYEVDKPGEELEMIIMNNLTEYDIVCDAVFRMVPHVVSNYFFSLNDLLELQRPWWDQNANNYLTLSDRVFFVAGDALFTDDIHTAGVFFNKKVYKDYYESQYGSLYDIVDEGKWTYDLMYEIARDFGRPDENGEWLNENAYYGILTDGYTGATMLTNGSGTVTAAKDEQGNITLNVASERSTRAFDKVYEILSDRATSIYAEQFNPTGWGTILNMFISGHGLFRIGYINSLLDIKEADMEDKVDPGVLPIPKFEEKQDSYYCGINAYQSDVLGIPVTNIDNLEATCYLMELLGYYSSSDSLFGKDSVTSAFYETTMKLQSVTDDNDSRMLDLIRSSRIYDLGGIFNWGGKLIGIYSSCLYKNTNSLITDWQSVESMTEMAMNDTIEAYKNSIN